MSDWLEELLARHRSVGMLVDTNILLLLFVGQVDRKAIATFKRTSQFTPADFDLLVSLLAKVDRLLTTPTVLAEVSNLGGQLTGRTRNAFYVKVHEKVGAMVEVFEPSLQLVAREPFLKFGLTDTAIEQAATDGVLVLTDDFRLAGYLTARELPVVNFNHLRFGGA